MNRTATVIAIALLAVSAAPVHAYLDPGTGSMILQMLIAGIVGALFTIKIYWYRLKGFFARLFGKTPAEAEREPAANLEQTPPKTPE